MDGSPSSIVMLGLGNGTFNGSSSLVVMLGFGVGEEDNGITGQWSNVITCKDINQKIEYTSLNRTL